MGIVVPLISACMTWPPHGQRSAPQWRRLLVKILGREPWIGTYGVCGLLALCRYPARPSVLLSPSVLLGRRQLTGSPWPPAWRAGPRRPGERADERWSSQARA